MKHIKPCKHNCGDYIIDEYHLDDKRVFKFKCELCGILWLDEYDNKDILTVEEFCDENDIELWKL